MLIRAARFNTYLLLLATICCFVGCQSPESKRKKQTAALRIHLEVPPNQTGFNEPVTVGRTSPMIVNVDKNPFLTESEVAEARIIDVFDGFALQIRFSKRGTWLLEQYSGANTGRRFAIFTQFGEKRSKSRALAAPRINHRIAEGIVTFTPDADRKEAEEIVLGLNNVAKKVQPKPETP